METFYLVLASILWGAVHSWLASFQAKGAAERIFGPGAKRWYRFAYNAFSVVSFAPILLLMVWLPDRPMYAVPLPWAALLYAVQLFALALLVIGVLQTDTLSFIGVRQLVQSADSITAGLVTGGLYRYVRHPLYTAGLLFLWATPQVSLNQCVTYAMLTVYIFFGAFFEERKLMREFGQAYADYRRRTPMLIPFLRLG